MNTQTWSISSSSEDESDEDRPVSKIKAPFYRHFQNDELGTNWPPTLQNCTASTSRINQTHQQNGNSHDASSRSLNSSIILPPDTNIEEDVVLVPQSGGTYCAFRVIPESKIKTPHKTPDAKHTAKKIKTEQSPSTQTPDEIRPPPDIPLEIIDHIDRPTDPRRPKRDELGDEDDQDQEFPLPRFWRETILSKAIEKNQNRNGRFKHSNSFIRERLLQSNRRLAQANQKRIDPRLERSLFSAPTRKVEAKTKSHNSTLPTAKSGSIFDSENMEDVSSESSSSSSFSSVPSDNDDQYNAHSSTQVNNLDMVSNSDSEGDYSFNAFTNKAQMVKKHDRSEEDVKSVPNVSNAPNTSRASDTPGTSGTSTAPKRFTRASMRLEKSTAEEKVPPIKIDLKKKQVRTTKTKTPQRNILLEKLPVVDKEAILSALTDDTASEDQDPWDEDVVPPKINGIIDEKKLNGKINNERKIRGHNLNFLYKTREAIPETPSAPTEPQNGTLKQEEPDKVGDIFDKLEDAMNEMVMLMNVPTQMDIATDPEPMDIKSPTNHINKTASDQSSTSIGSIEQRLADMTSPVKTIAEARAEKIEAEKLSNLLSACGLVKELQEEQTDVQNGALRLPDINTETSSSNDSGIHTFASPPGTNSEDTMGSPKNDKNEKQNPEISSANTVTAVNKAAASTSSEEAKVAKDQVETPIAYKEGSVEQVNTTTSEKNLSIVTLNGMPEIGATTEIFGANEINIDEYAKDLDPSELEDIGKVIGLNAIPDSTSDLKTVPKPQTGRIIIEDYFEKEGNGQILKDEQTIAETAMAINMKEVANMKSSSKSSTPRNIKTYFTTVDTDVENEMSDDDFEEDLPCGMDDLTLPNSNTDTKSSVANILNTNCNLCSYHAKSGWKQLAKHYVRKHPGKEISISRLCSQFNPQDLPIDPLITHNGFETLIYSLCYICNNAYKMSSSKWLMHFISHTGEFEFRCNECQKDIIHDLHKACNSKGNTRINGPHDFVDNVLYGYVCIKCNYIQLSKQNVMAHLENEHQQMITNESESNIVEFPLLKMTQSMDLMLDDKNDKPLIEAKQRYSAIHHTNRYDNFEPVVLSDDEPEPSVGVIDLTLSDDDI